jgi:hypothetical protein
MRTTLCDARATNGLTPSLDCLQSAALFGSGLLMKSQATVEGIEKHKEPLQGMASQSINLESTARKDPPTP